MAEYKIDSWGSEQLARLHEFFVSKAKPDDVVIFDRALAERNVSTLEGLDDNECNSFVYRCANQALEGLDDDRKRLLSETIKLTTRFLFNVKDYLPENTGVGPESEEEEYYELDTDLLEPAPENRAGPDADAEEWAKTLANYHAREPS